MAAAPELRSAQAGRHRVPRPLPEPPRTWRVSRSAPPPRDHVEAALEQWMADLAVGSTIEGD